MRLAERVNGEIPAPVAFDYIWGEALTELEAFAPALRVINLETAVTGNGSPWPRKGIHYRMHPDNLPAVEAAGVDVAVLANNHVLDWGREGHEQSLAALASAGIACCGAGRSQDAACAPVALETGDGRMLIFALAMASSGVPASWAAGAQRSGVCYTEQVDAGALAALVERIETHRQPGDRVVVSIHWGGNWGYEVGADRRRFARELIDRAGVDIVHGHSSHHPAPLEFHNGGLILYGCGDLINDYEGIGGKESFRPDLSLMYFPEFERGGRGVARLRMAVMRIERFRLHRAAPEDARWLAGRLTEVSARGTCVVHERGNRLQVKPA